MSFEVDVSGPLQAAARLRGINAASVVKAERRAIATLVRRLPVAARRDIQDQYTMRVAAITERLSAKAQSGQAVVLTGRAKGVGLHLFRHTYSRTRGVTSRVEKVKPAAKITAAWVGKSGRIFRREKDASRPSGFVARLPYRALFGPSVAFMLRDGERRERLGQIAQSVLAAEIDRLVATLGAD